MKAGSLAYVVTVQRWNAEAVNAFGTQAGAWQHLATMRAELVELALETRMSGRGAEDETVTIFRVRNRLEIALADRLAFRSKWYSIRQVVPTGGRADALELHCVTFKGQAA